MKKVLACILAVLDITFLIVIISAIRTDHLEAKENEGSEISSEYRSEAYTDTTNKPIENEQNYHSTQDDFMPSDIDTPGFTESVDIQENETTSVRYDPSLFDTKEQTLFEDFLWVTNELYEKEVTGNVDRLTAKEIKGGWKTYIIANTKESHGTMSEFLLNTYIEGDEDAPTVRLDWSYIYMTETEEVFEDDKEDLILDGRWNGKGITADGAISIDFTDFYYKDGKEYGVGKLVDAVGKNADVFLVRP